MTLSTLLLAFSIHFHAVSDSLPPLHSFKNSDIDTVIASYKEKSITIKLRMGETYLYQKADWEKQNDRKFESKLNEATGLLDRTFTKAEVAPSFPGGPSAWSEYLQKYFSENKGLIKKEGPAVVFVQFIVGFDGTADNVSLMNTDAPQGLGALAIRMIQEGPSWIPATQNGFKVSCYQRQRIDFK